VAGLFWAPTYARETALWATQGIGGDAVNLLVVVPLLLISGLKTARGSDRAQLVWLGTQGYLLYNFFIYAFAVHFNALFLVYCAVLGFSFCSTLCALPRLDVEAFASACAQHAPRRLVAVMFFTLAALTAAGWLKEDIPAIVHGLVPDSIPPTGLPVNPVHILDLSFLLPALVITAVLLLRGRAIAHVLAPPLVVVLALISLEIAGIGAALIRKGYGGSPAMVILFVGLGCGFAALAWRYLRLIPARVP